VSATRQLCAEPTVLVPPAGVSLRIRQTVCPAEALLTKPVSVYAAPAAADVTGFLLV
jgi:hypothetical protein